MTNAPTLARRADFRARDGTLLVVRDVAPAAAPPRHQPPTVPPDPVEGDEVLLAVLDDGTVVALHGHVDLGTGLRTALAQIVAEELDVPLASVTMVLGDTARAPNQGATIASASIQLHAAPLRAAAAQARGWLVAEAASRLGTDPGMLATRDGAAWTGDRRVDYADLVRGRHVELRLDPLHPVKDAAEHRVVGRSVPRVDIPAKVAGEAVFVHDVRLPGMLHGRVVRPPYAGADHGDFVGDTLESVDESSVADVPGMRAVVVIRDFVGVVAEREEQAETAAARLAVRWKRWPRPAPTDDVAAALSAHPSTARRLVDEGDLDATLVEPDVEAMARTYTWPYQLHASIGPSCAVADWHGDGGEFALTVWAGTQNPHVLRADLATLIGVEPARVSVVRVEAAGCYGGNGADDVAADAALLARAVGAPVRVQLTREQEHLWEPKGAAQWMTVRGGLARDGSVAAYDFATSYPSNGAPTLALLLTRTVEPVAQAFEMGDRTARPPYDFGALRVTVHDMAPILRASWLRGVSALPNVFAHESFVDELATAADADPVAFRLAHLFDPRGRALVEATATKAGWRERTAPGGGGATGDVAHGQGFAYARYLHGAWPGQGAAWSAWVADVDVDRVTGEVHVKRVVVGQDAGAMINPAGVRHQIHGNVVQTTSRALRERVRTDPSTHVVAAREWGAYPILSFRDVPTIEVLTIARPGDPPLGVGESASVPGTAAIANAIFDATGVRFRSPPFTAEVVRAALGASDDAAGAAPPLVGRGREAPSSIRVAPVRFWRRAALVAAGGVAACAALLGARSEIAPVAWSARATFDDATIARGAALAAIGDCGGCHTAPGGALNAGGVAIETPFGVVWGTNITPDVETGIGAWSFSAFQRAMRDGVSRAGHRLYPAFPYPSFTRASDDDLAALYAWSMTRPAVRAEAPRPRLAFPLNVRPLLAAWNGLKLSPGPRPADGGRSAAWNRGRDLVDGLGHCGACHTPRDALGAERTTTAYLGGAMVDGWEAPALNAASRAPVAWSEQALFDYLRSGYSREHGAAHGPMAPIVRTLGVVPDADLRAMANYLASLVDGSLLASPRTSSAAARTHVAAVGAASPLPDASSRLFESACGACHHDGDGPRVLGTNVPLALATKLAADRPDNALRVILEGVREPAGSDVGFMPSFADAFDDRQLVALATWLRRRFALDRAPWRDLDAAVARVRSAPPRPRSSTTEPSSNAPSP